MNVDEVMKNFTGNGTMAYGVDTAIKALRPGCKYEVSVGGGEYTYTKWWHPDKLPPPTKKEIDAELEYQKKLAVYYQYAYSRCAEYPDGFEQLDMLWHDMKNGVIPGKEGSWFKSIEAVKEKFPKPEGSPPVKE